MSEITRRLRPICGLEETMTAEESRVSGPVHVVEGGITTKPEKTNHTEACVEGPCYFLRNTIIKHLQLFEKLVLQIGRKLM